ncbi:hypothetical protein QTP70_009525 [Hemibagrus guttatus]|uniref:ribonuclease H n=1 Tax=Hemibagrus guttatus TaxID=175788 RepID=A0AAE0PSI7_9TELE|nr:hypothetical protein QTP70_009525 [Hemibagrus guttatus]
MSQRANTQDMYERSRTVVRCAVGQTEEFKVEVGLHQGSALSPFLFPIVMDQLSEEVRQESPWTMMFADGIVICSESREQVEENLERWRFALERRGMKVSRNDQDQVLCLSTADVKRTLCRVNPRKSAGPDNIPGRVLRECAEQLVDVFTDIFNISLSSAIVPTCLKTTTIVPVLKKSTVSCLNDYHPFALTPIMMKCFERLVMRHTKTQLPPSMDPMQFAYRPNRSTDDAITTTLHLSLTHLDNKDTYVQMLFIDFSSAFNTIIPQHLIEKLSLLGLNTSL